MLVSEQPEAERASHQQANAPSTDSVDAPTLTSAPRLPNPVRDSPLQKIAQLDTKGRMQLAIKGSREERAILIRDRTRLVALAVLDSPKLTDSELEQFASQRNMVDAVLRGLAANRRFLKNYPVLRNLVFNPRTPLDISLTLIKNLLTPDLRLLAANREVDDTLSKLAARTHRQRMEANRRG